MVYSIGNDSNVVVYFKSYLLRCDTSAKITNFDVPQFETLDADHFIDILNSTLQRGFSSHTTTDFNGGQVRVVVWVLLSA